MDSTTGQIDLHSLQWRMRDIFNRMDATSKQAAIAEKTGHMGQKRNLDIKNLSLCYEMSQLEGHLKRAAKKGGRRKEGIDEEILIIFI